MPRIYFPEKTGVHKPAPLFFGGVNTFLFCHENIYPLILQKSPKNDIKTFLEALVKQQLLKMKTDFYCDEIKRIKLEVKEKKIDGTASDYLEKQAGSYLSKFKAAMKQAQEYQLLSPLCGDEFREIMASFEPTFYQEHNSAVQTLLIEEHGEAKRCAEEEAKRKGEEAAISEQKAREKEAEAAAAEGLKNKAEIQAQKDREAAEKAKKDLTLSEAEKNHFEEEARKAEIARERATADAKEARETANKALEDSREQIIQYQRQMKDLEKKTVEMQQMYSQRLSAMERDLNERRAEAEREKAELRSELSQLKEGQQEERQALQRQIQESQAQNARALQEAQERFQKEKESWQQSQSSHEEGGHFVFVPTNHGWALCRVR